MARPQASLHSHCLDLTFLWRLPLLQIGNTFELAAYALTSDELQEIFEHSADEVGDYIKGIVTAGVMRYEDAEDAGKLASSNPHGRAKKARIVRWDDGN